MEPCGIIDANDDAGLHLVLAEDKAWKVFERAVHFLESRSSRGGGALNNIPPPAHLPPRRQDPAGRLARPALVEFRRYGE
jgi:hypothetical protein